MIEIVITQLLDLSNYTFNIHPVPLIVLGMISLTLGFMVLAHERFSRISISFFIVTLTSNVWFFGFGWIYNSNNESIAFLWAKAAYLAVPFIGGINLSFLRRGAWGISTI
jgi:hypothetical protein